MTDAPDLERSLQEATQLLQGAQRIAVLAHVNPDADAIGSVIGLTCGLRELDKEVVPALSDPVPDYARFLHGSDAIRSYLVPDSFDVYVFADSAGIERVGDLYARDPGRFERAAVLNVDHHRTNPRFGTVNYVDPTASSTAELSYRLLRALGAPINEATANALLFGIIGDTGSFQNGATTSSAMETAAELVKLGADSQRIAFQLFDCKSFTGARLWGRVVSTIELDRRRRIVFAYMSQQMLREEHAKVDEIEGVAEYLRGVEEAEVVMLLKEREDGSVRVSMRSRPEVDVSAIATVLGGGGHRQAAGCTLPGPFSSTKETLLTAFDELNRR